ncbi:hypothetical protein AMC99_01423 [Altererythrobacter epoxidivorans]|uniref:Uncharacterized protein n=1 Tax=Altererythrobacter epoxidivorans TaxID=361183 RepID=A0A0M3TAH3_9SPHN|nr:hypothetical protein AMC99_01423 [Altererythrobacter epoxidivorans]
MSVLIVLLPATGFTGVFYRLRAGLLGLTGQEADISTRPVANAEVPFIQGCK